MNQDVFHVVWNIDRDLSSARLSSHMWSFAAPDMNKVVYPVKPWCLKCFPEIYTDNEDFERSTLYFSAHATLSNVLEAIQHMYKPVCQKIWFLGFEHGFYEDSHLPMFRCYLQVI